MLWPSFRALNALSLPLRISTLKTRRCRRTLQDEEPYFELIEKMPHLTNPKLISAMRLAVADVAQTRYVLHRAHQVKKEEECRKAVEREKEIYKVVIYLVEMHEGYEKMLSEAEIRLERIYEAAVEGYEKMLSEAEIRLERIYEAAVEGKDEAEVSFKEKENGPHEGAEEMNEEVVRILRDAESGKAIERMDLAGRRLRLLPEEFGRFKSLVTLNLSNSLLEVRVCI
ncbi:unnamed protein product [Fraxinus pennsylvanica]|uniref:Uncharacterized protein n=1 Tax=Fraxinus pennsylvanica TaxID=56036 RepID=A0AAD1YVZ2_9LAMI|nr:unnamed protein product [Fraxinus pennsylvanica]